MRYLSGALAALAMACCPSIQPALAGPETDPSRQNVFVMGGAFTTGYFVDTFAFWEDHYDDNRFAGVGYQYFFLDYAGGLRLGAEVGAGLRWGDSTSTEIWGGMVARYDGFQLGGFSISPAVTFGLSATTGPVGVEADRAASTGSNAPVLYYLAPEIAVSHESAPNLELLARVQHRSGGFGTIARIDASNALVVGLRYKF